MNLDFSIFSRPPAKTVGTPGTRSIDAVSSVPTSFSGTGDAGDKLPGDVLVEGGLSPLSPVRSNVLGTDGANVYAVVPTVPTEKAVTDAIPPHDPTAWREPFMCWLKSACTYHPRCFGGIGRLQVAFFEWEVAHDEP